MCSTLSTMGFGPSFISWVNLFYNRVQSVVNVNGYLSPFRAKSKDLWLGSWRGCLDPPVDLDWSSLKLKVLGVFIGAGDLVEENWWPRVDAVAKVLSSWRSRSLSFRGKALVINALALSRIWYVASLVYMPPRILHELCTILFNFFWSGKKDLVSCTVVVQSPLLGRFSVVDVKLKVLSLLAQWVKRFASSCSGSVLFMSYWFDLCLSASAMDVFSAPSSFHPGDVPPFYKSLVLAWRELGGAFSVFRSSLVFGAADPLFCVPVYSMTTKSWYLFLLSERLTDSHCVEKFAPTFGVLYWPSTWPSLSFFDLDRQVIDLNWKIAHGILYTAESLFSFGLSIPLPCFCGAPVETLSYLFFACPLAQSVLSWLQSLMFLLTRCLLFCLSVICFLVLILLSYA